jgi:NAD(P)-dependent dehydrogenase (short-subunit alcohol dehydrogenase family)
MNDQFKDKTTLVTGGSSGIGRATAIMFASRGATVVIASRSEQESAKTIEAIATAGGKAKFIKTDVTSESQVEALIDSIANEYGNLDYAFNNAGAQPVPSATTDQTEDDWDKMLAVNLKGAWLCMKHELRHMLKVGRGSIVNNASISGLVGIATWPAQCASKHGVVGLTRAVAIEYAKSGIRVNVVCPGAIETPMLQGLTGGDPEFERAVAAAEPMGRVGTPEEVAEAVLWLSSDASSFVTGHALAVDGGWVAQ